MSPDKRPDLIATALARFKVAVEASKNQRLRELADLRFQVPELQWDDEVRKQRMGQVIDGIPVPPRPMVSVSKIDQPVRLITNQERAAHLGVQVSAIDLEANDETAEVIQDIYRGIERDSRAHLARSWGFNRAVKVGFGAYRILTEYDRQSDNPKDQKIVIKRILNQNSVYLDPFAQEPDWSDGRWAFLVTDMPWDRYVAEFGEVAGKRTKLAHMNDSELVELGNEQPGWINGDKESRAVRVAEYFYLEGFGEKTTVHWCKINAVEKLQSTTLPGEWIPIIPTLGDELHQFDDERRFTGIYTQGKGAQQVFNYQLSGALEAGALAPMSPWVGYEGQFEGHEAKWGQANTRRFPYLEVRPITAGGQIAPLPERTSQSADITSHLALLQVADEAIQSSTFTPDAALGKLSAQGSKPIAARAIQSLQQQSDIGNSNYIQNLKDMSVLHEARIILSWIPVYYARPGRLVRTVTRDDKAGRVMVNQPFYTDPQRKRPMALMEGQQPPADRDGKPFQVKHYDLTKGVYEVAVTVGKSYPTGRKEGSEALGNLFGNIPQVFPMLGDIWAQFQDWPGHEEAAERLKKMLPPQLQGDDSGQPTVEQLQQELQKGAQAFTMLQQQAMELKQEVDTDRAKQEGQIEIAKIKESSAVTIEQMRINAELEKARIDAQAKIAIEQIKAQFQQARAEFDAEIADQDRAAESVNRELDRQHESTESAQGREFEASEAERARSHEAALVARETVVDGMEADKGRMHETTEAARGRMHEGLMAEREAEQERELSQIGHEQTIEQQKQAAKVKPKPKGKA